MSSSLEAPRPLEVTVVGAGIGGLATAISLRRKGHNVKVFETYPVKTEVGAGMSVPINALRILERFGFSMKNLRAVDFDGVVLYDATKNGAGTPRPWLISTQEKPRDILCYRTDLHDELKRLAIGEGVGRPAEIHLNSQVVACDPDAGTITLRDGEIIQSDLVIGADGIHALASGWSCFRCTFDAAKLKELPNIEWLTEGLPGARNISTKEGPFRMFFVYPCRDGTLLNFAGIYPDAEQDIARNWTSSATLEDIHRTFHDFHPRFLQILGLPLHSTILRWQAARNARVQRWRLRRRPHSDVCFRWERPKAEIPARLSAYELLRKERGEFVEMESLSQATVPAKRGLYFRSREMQSFVMEARYNQNRPRLL
ncbi:FAD/NAD(P)-binding domain-containing protein [Mycena filopes]|nr:FAD/NAD(P)-binding domain-containing protein [Mycena filopes]